MAEKPTYEELERWVKESEKENTERKRVEKSLRESEERFRMIFTNSTDGIIVADPETKKFIHVNPAICKTLGYTEEELIQMGVVDIHPKNSLEYVVSEFEAQSKGEKLLVINIPFLKKDGTIIYMDTNSSMVKIDEKRRIIGIFRDITERKRAEEKLLIANERLQYLLSSTTAVIYTAKTHGDYGATFISNNVTQTVGYEPHEFLLDSSFWFEHIHPEDKSNVEKEVLKVFENNLHWYEYRFLCKDGQYLWIRDEMKLVRDNEGNPLEIIGYWTDITERKQAEDTLLKSNERLEEKVKERTTEIEEKNVALRVLIEQRESDKIKLEESIMSNVSELILPNLTRLRNSKLSGKQQVELNVLEANLNEITSPFASNVSSIYLKLTPTELQVANFIKNGASSKEIAESLSLSRRTVDTHRYNIRKKFGLRGKGSNLRTYLTSLT